MSYKVFSVAAFMEEPEAQQMCEQMTKEQVAAFLDKPSKEKSVSVKKPKKSVKKPKLARKPTVKLARNNSVVAQHFKDVNKLKRDQIKANGKAGKATNKLKGQIKTAKPVEATGSVIYWDKSRDPRLDEARLKEARLKKARLEEEKARLQGKK
jgi:hypothetical protein